MLIALSQFNLGEKRAKCYVGEAITAFELNGLSTSALNSTGGILDPSHLETLLPDELVTSETLAVLAAENAAQLVSDEGGLEVLGGCFAFDSPEGSESQIVVRFIPSIESIVLLPTFQRNLRVLTSILNDEQIQSIKGHASAIALLPDMCIPVKVRGANRNVDALLHLELRAGVASIGALRLFGSPDEVVGTATVFQTHGYDEVDVFEVGRVESLMVYRRMTSRA
jgi:hypothetical protein